MSLGRGLKKIRSDARTTVLKHPSGHEVRIAHSGLSPEMRARLEASPDHLADGGLVGGDITADDPQASVQGAQMQRGIGAVADYMGRKAAEDTAAYHANPLEWARQKGLDIATGTLGAGESVGGKLPMDEASRLGRAKGMGFDLDTPQYHGTHKDFQEFSLPGKEQKNTYGSAVYMSEKPWVAEGYARDNPGKNVIPLYHSMSKPFDFDHSIPQSTIQGLKKILGEKLTSSIVGSFPKDDIVTNSNLYRELKHKLGNDPDATNDVLKKLGYDGLNIPNEKITAVFDPAKIRSKFADFDPAKKDKAGLSYAQGGAVDAFKGLKKVSSTPHMTILMHPAGHEIRIAHAGLSEPMRIKLGKIPTHLADGGEVPAEQPNPEAAPTADLQNPAEESTAHKIGAFLRNSAQNSPMMQIAGAGVKAANAIGSAAEPFVEGLSGEKETPPEGAKSPEKEPPLGYSLANYQKEAPMGQAQAQPYQSPYEKEAMAAGNYARAQQKVMETYQGHMKALQDERTALMQDYKNGHVDPNKYMTDMDPGQRIGMMIGLMGTGQAREQVMAHLNANINRSVQAQAADLGVKENLLSANLKQFGNLKDATDMTRTMLHDILTAQMQEEAVKMQDPMARQRMMMAMQQMQQQANAHANNVATRGAVRSVSQDGGMPPQMQVDYMIQDPHEKETATKEIASADQVEKLRGAVLGSFQHLAGKTLAGELSPSDRASAMNAFSGPLAKVAEGRFNFQEAEQQMKALMPSPLDSAKTKQNKLSRLNQYFETLHTTPVLDAYNIKIPRPVSNTSPGVNAPASYGKTR